jgi:membrane carboxypeptidase/penicillin-binding protein PbpC
VAALVTDILADDMARLPAFGEGSVLALDRPAAAKTGTTTDFRDNWAVGYTPDLVAGVWVGNADNTPMEAVSGITGAGPIWHALMVAAHRGRPPRPFARPRELVTVRICETTGLRPTEHCPRQRGELFIRGTEPVDLDWSYRVLDVDAASGLRWVPGCRGPKVSRVFRLLPADAVAWGRREGIATPPERLCMDPLAAEAAPDQPVSRGPGPAVALTEPAPATSFALSAALPDELERLELAAEPSGLGAGVAVTLFVDDGVVATIRRPPFRALWPLAPGRHVARAVATDASGQRVASAAVPFTVLEREPQSAVVSSAP